MAARFAAPLLLVLALLGVVVATDRPSSAADGPFVRISGEGSSWAANLIDATRVDLEPRGITVDYNPTGSTAGRKNFLNGTVDFAASDVPFQFTPEDGSFPESPAPGTYAYLPVAAGGLAFVYNLRIGGQRVTNLRLAGDTVAKIFTGAIDVWNDPAIRADNPGLDLPPRQITPVVRAEGSGSTQLLTEWMIDQHPQTWQAHCVASGRAPACGPTSFYPTIPGMISQSGDLGVVGYVSQGFAEGSIGYANYSYALGAQLPAVKLLNQAGYYVEPTPANVAVSLLAARIVDDASDPTTYLTHDLAGLYTDPDPRTYQLAATSYLIVPTVVFGAFHEAKGKTLAEFAYHQLCRAQLNADALGYAPLPVNLVAPSIDLLDRIPGADTTGLDLANCANPTILQGGQDALRTTVPMPPSCDLRSDRFQCSSGTGGLANQSTPTVAPPARFTIGLTPSSGTGTTPFRFDLGRPLSCLDGALPGGPAGAPRWHTFLTPATNDPATLAFGPTGPSGPGFTLALSDSSGAPVADRVADPSTGLLGAVPDLSLDPLGASPVPEGTYTIGIACTDAGTVTSIWSARLTITPGAGVGAFAFSVIEPVLIQDLRTRRPQGALVLTQRCGVHGSAPAYSDPVFGSLPPLTATSGADPVGADPPTAAGTAPLLDTAPGDPNAGLGAADPLFPQYPYPVDGNGDAAPNYPTNCGIDLGTGALVTSGPRAGQYFRATGRLAQLTVVNTRDSDSGWTLNGRMSSFVSTTDATDSFSGNLLGWDPEVTWDSGANLDGYDMVVNAGGTRQPEPSASTTGLGAPFNSTNTGLAGSLAQSPSGNSLGQAVIDARLRLLVPVTADAGTYRGTLTFTTV